MRGRKDAARGGLSGTSSKACAGRRSRRSRRPLPRRRRRAESCQDGGASRRGICGRVAAQTGGGAQRPNFPRRLRPLRGLGPRLAPASARVARTRASVTEPNCSNARRSESGAGDRGVGTKRHDLQVSFSRHAHGAPPGATAQPPRLPGTHRHGSPTPGSRQTAWRPQTWGNAGKTRVSPVHHAPPPGCSRGAARTGARHRTLDGTHIVAGQTAAAQELASWHGMAPASVAAPSIRSAPRVCRAPVGVIKLAERQGARDAGSGAQAGRVAAQRRRADRACARSPRVRRSRQPCRQKHGVCGERAGSGGGPGWGTTGAATT